MITQVAILRMKDEQDNRIKRMDRMFRLFVVCPEGSQ